AMLQGAHLSGGAETPLVAAKSVGLELQGKQLLEYLAAKGFTLGGHDADTNRSNNYENGTGCGACDKCENCCGLLDECHSEAEPLMQSLMNEDFDENIYKNLKLTA